jgi:hypothetical protein
LRDTRPDEMQRAANECVKAYRLAVDFLTNELPISSHAYLPYGLQLTHLVEFFRLKPRPTLEQRERLRRWIWHTSLSRYFRSSNTTQNASDLANMRAFAQGKGDALDLDTPTKYESFVSDSFALNKATSKTFALLLANHKPRSLLDGSPINVYQALAVANRHEYHHIFPQAYLRSSGLNQRKVDVNANICLLCKGNNAAIADQRPSVYFRELLARLGENLHAVLLSNYIDQNAYEAALRDDYDAFLGFRSRLLIEAARLLAGTQGDSEDVEEAVSAENGNVLNETDNEDDESDGEEDSQ